MSDKTNIRDVAKRAGVSTATVDRVLHGRGGYSAKSAECVTRAIDELGYGQLAPHLNHFRKNKLKFSFLLPALACNFRNSLADAAKRMAKQDPNAEIDISIKYTHLVDGKDTINTLDSLRPNLTDAVCLFAVDAPGVREAIDRTVDRGITVCTIVSDIPSSRRAGYVGLDNVAAGRTAGRLIARMIKQKEGAVGVVTGSNRIRDHIERYLGLTQSLAQHAPGLTLLAPMEGNSFDNKNFALTKELMEKHQNLVALYSIGGGNIGVIDAIRAHRGDREIVTVVHELEPKVRDALLDGTIDICINQNPEDMMRSVFDAMVRGVDGKPSNLPPLVSEIFVAENLP